jgi:phospholipid-binding lipoprotein MlaA
MKFRFGALVLVCTVLIQGCASTKAGPDPLESWNRSVFDLNDKLDEALLAPVARGYQTWVPQAIRTGIGNFTANTQDAWSAANQFFQGRPADGLSDAMRFLTNSTFGLLGFLDVATELGLERHGEDFGQTLGVWGVKPGPYIVWPLFGPSTMRDSSVALLDQYASVDNAITPVYDRYAVTGARLLHARASLLGASGMLDSISLDKYLFIRDSFLQRRRSLVYNGNPPEEDFDEGAER